MGHVWRYSYVTGSPNPPRPGHRGMVGKRRELMAVLRENRAPSQTSMGYPTCFFPTPFAGFWRPDNAWPADPALTSLQSVGR